MDEIMKPITGYEGLYSITNQGRVWSHSSNRFLSPYRRGRGYLGVKLYKKGKSKQFKVHRLVAEAFLENPDGLPQVNHKDENKHNNCVDNLEWCDAKYNMNYFYQMRKLDFS